MMENSTYDRIRPVSSGPHNGKRAMLAMFSVTLGLILIVILVAMIAKDAVAQGPDTFWFYEDTYSDGYMMYRTQQITATGTDSGVVNIFYYSAEFPDGASIGAGTATLYLYATSSSGKAEELVLRLVADSTEIGVGGIIIPPDTPSPTVFTTTFTYVDHTFTAPERLRLKITKQQGVCWYWDGPYNDSRLVLENLTVVTLASFTATGHDSYVLLEWETASEIDNAGFNIWRSEAEADPYTKLNADLIPTQGGPTTAASYSYLDDAVTNGVTYWYKLEDVDLYGVGTMHGPVSATPQRLHWIYLPLLLKRSAP